MNVYPSVRTVFDFKRIASASKKGVVSIEITYKGKRKRGNTGMKVFPNQWSPRIGVVKTVDAPALNEAIHKISRDIVDWINTLRENREEFTFEKLKVFLNKPARPNGNFMDFLQKRINSRPDIRESTRRTQRKLIGSLEDFGTIRLFSDLTIGIQKWR